MVDTTVSGRRKGLVDEVEEGLLSGGIAPLLLVCCLPVLLLCLRCCLPWGKVRELGKFLAFNIIVTASNVITNGLTAVTLSELSFHLSIFWSELLQVLIDSLCGLVWSGLSCSCLSSSACPSSYTAGRRCRGFAACSYICRWASRSRISLIPFNFFLSLSIRNTKMSYQCLL